jgi:histidyl-tRNA synthetase
LREHWQLNVDIFGLKGIEAEHEVILVADSILKTFGATHDMYTIKLNSRKLVDTILGDYLGLDEVQAYSMSKLIDRMNKMEHAEFIAQADALFSPSEREAGNVDKLLNILKVKKLTDLPAELQDHASVKELERMFKLLEDSLVTNAEFDPSLMRGFDYYTDIVFEVFDNHPDNNRAMLGGGRYDGLVGLFGVDPVPTVGFGFGDVTLANFLEIHELLPPIRTETDLYTVLIGDVFEKAQKSIAELREMGLNVAVDLTGRKVGDQIKVAEKKGIHYIVVIGEKELTEEQFTLKNLLTGVEEKHSLQRIVSIIKDYRHE